MSFQRESSRGADGCCAVFQAASVFTRLVGCLQFFRGLGMSRCGGYRNEPRGYRGFVRLLLLVSMSQG